ncbi:MAG: serine hydrolase [Vicinamibacterales bacterium]|nr:serine hydrolase [Vicinamibacterales bacterium]MDP7691625.1 serine hydrolase [Vicinamibacterales bacterium]HJN44810.1 serine hydrolase [Vicinamibacterales bacterium]
MANTRRVCGGLLACVGAAGLTWLILSVALGAGYDPTRGGVVATPASVLDAGVGRGAPGAGAVPAPRRVPSVPVPRVRAQAAIIFDPVTGETLWERNSRDLRSIASITKVMTVMLFLEQQPDLSREVVISRRDVRRASTTYLRRGERVSLRDLVHLSLVASDNAAARALARVSPWGTKRFIARMNAKAAALDLQQTRFTGPSGLDEGNVSSAYDVSRLIAEASRRPQVSQIMRKRSYRIRTSRRARTIRSTNRLLGTRVDVMAGKTGYIDEAGYCLATLVQLEDGRSVSVVVLGARSNSGRFSEARRLVDWLSTQASVLLTSAAE